MAVPPAIVMKGTVKKKVMKKKKLDLVICTCTHKYMYNYRIR
jgi:hypothetical protein